MAVTILFIHKRIIIDKVLVTSIIRRVNVNDIYLPCMSIRKCGEGIEVISLNEHMIGRTDRRGVQTLGGILHENGQFLLHTVVSLFRAVLPYKSVTFLLAYHLQQLVLQFLVYLKPTYLLAQRPHVYFPRHIGVSFF